MIALDTCFLVDYLDGADDARAFLEERETKPFFAPSLALFEVYRGAARTSGRDGLDRVASGLDWVEPLPLTDDAAREAPLVEAELLDESDRINLGNALIAGVCRHNGARIVTRERVDGPAVVSY